MQNCVNGSSSNGTVSVTLAGAPDFLTIDEAAHIRRVGRNQAYELARGLAGHRRRKGCARGRVRPAAASAQGGPAAPGWPGANRG